MKLRYKIANGVLLLILLALCSLAVALSYNKTCGPAPAIASGTTLMQAVVYRCYGAPEVLSYEQIEKPTPADDEVLVKVHAAAVNPADWHYMRGSPYVLRLSSGIGAPDDTSMGVDFAGTVEAVGAGVSRFKPGDQVFGGRGGAFGEYLVIPESRALAIKPDNMTFEQAAAVPIAGISALQGLRDKGKIAPGMKVLINGASGGVGTLAVQIAKAYDTEVTGVCSTRNLELVRSLGADHVIDYTKQDYTSSGIKYDLIIDNVGNHSPWANQQALAPGGTVVMIGGPSGDWVGPLLRPLQAMVYSSFSDESFELLMAKLTGDDLVALGKLMEEGKLTPAIGKRYPLRDIAAAVAYSETGRARGKIIIEVP